MRGLLLLLCSSPLAPGAFAQVPSYRVDVVAAYTATTTLAGASDAGHFVGYQVVGGQIRAYAATLATGLTLLPLPPGYVSSAAFDANDSGVVVGTVATNGFPYDFGEPAIWTPNVAGGYDVTIPQQFTTLPSPLGNLSINGGMAVGVNNNGTIVGWSRYQGFQGGPTTQFSLTGAPVNLGALGFAATVRAVNDNDVIVGGDLRMDLGTGAVTSIGLPPPLSTSGGSFAFVIAYAVNDSEETVVAAHLATSTSDRWLTYYHDDANGYTRLNPAALPSPFVGFYDNNDRGDVAASGGVLFRAEGVLAGGFDGLLEPGSASWDTSLGFIDNDRRVCTTATHAGTGAHALVLLTPLSVGADYCSPAVSNSTGAAATLRGSGSSWVASNDLTLVADQLPSQTFGYFLNSRTQGSVAQPGGSQGVLCLGGAIGRYSASVLNSGLAGSIALALDLGLTPTPTGPVAVLAGESWSFQAWYRDQNPGATSNFTNGLRVTFE